MKVVFFCFFNGHINFIHVCVHWDRAWEIYPEKKSVLWNYDALDLHMHLYSNFCLHVRTLTHTASQDLNAENSSLGDILEESDWDVNSDVAMATEGRGGALMKRSLQSEKEIRYITKKKCL